MVPIQVGLVEAEIETETFWTGLTVMVTVLDVAVVTVIQEEFEVILQTTTSPFNGA